MIESHCMLSPINCFAWPQASQQIAGDVLLIAAS